MNPTIPEFQLFTFDTIRCRIGKTYKYRKPLAYYIEDIITSIPISLDQIKAKLKEEFSITPTHIEVRTSISSLRYQDRIKKKSGMYFLDTL